MVGDRRRRRRVRKRERGNEASVFLRGAAETAL